MEDFNAWSAITFNSIETLANTFMMALPKILGALLLLIIGYIVAKILKWVIVKALTLANVNRLTDKLREADVLKNKDLVLDATKIIGQFVFWLVILIFVITASDTLGLHVVSEKIGELVSYLPVLLGAVIIFLVGLYIASFIKKILATTFESFGLMGAMLVSNLCYYLILAIVTITALAQAGIDTWVLTSNITIILGSVLFAFAIAFGLGSKELFQNLLSGIYAQRSLNVGDEIKFADVEGIVESISGISVTITTKRSEVVIPARELMLNKFEIIKPKK